MKNYLAIIGTFRPTIDGATNITELFYEKSLNYNFKTLKFKYKTFKNYNKKYQLLSRTLKFFSFLKILTCTIFNSTSIKIIYIQENGGYGKLYDIIFFILFLSLKKKCYYHHHSYAKINKYSFLSQITQFLERYGIINIFLNKEEATKFINIYGKVRYKIISNSAFLRKGTYKKNILINKKTNITFGLISNLTKEKGLLEFIDFAKFSLYKNENWNFNLAGPIIEDKDFYLRKINKINNINYMGLLKENKQKDNFFRNIDFFIFLSKHIHESESLVVLEAISHGCIPIVFDRGSIKKLIPNKKLIIKDDRNISSSIYKLIKDIFVKNETELLSKSSSEKYISIKKIANKNLNNLFKEVERSFF